MLEFDHREPVARGGEATAENLRLVCRSHNQHAAERTFGAAFMERKREAAKAERGRAAQRAGRRGGGPDALPRRCHAAAPRP
jgi:5-methylcytosine-specific restriction endonuclease McrA